MPESNPEPEKYSIDDMLDRLKGRDDVEDQGKLVTRADGTEAVKVRKRKRRTDQTKDKFKEQNQRVQLIQIAGFIVFCVAMLIVAGVLIVYANSSGFRDSLIRKVEDSTGSQAKIHQFRMNPATASATRMDLSWAQGHVVSRMEVTGLRANIAPINFIGKVFQGEEVTASKGNLFLSIPGSGESSTAAAGEDGAPLIRFKRYSVSSFNVFFSAEQKRDQILENTEATYLPIRKKEGGEIRLNRGMLRLKGWPLLELDSSYIQVRSREMDIQNMRFQLPTAKEREVRDKGSINISGVIRPMDTGVTHALSVTVDSFPIASLLGVDLGKFFRGWVMTDDEEGSNLIEFQPGSGIPASLKLHLTHAVDSHIDFTQFRFMGQLAATLGDPWFDMPRFESHVKLLINRNDESVRLEEMHLEQRGRMTVQGNLSASGDAGKISGDLMIGLPETILAASANRRLDALFGPVKNGYRWMKIEIGGTSGAPVDNFKELYQAVVILTETSENNTEVKEKTAEKKDGADTFESLIEVE
jgi:hypothetical protein